MYLVIGANGFLGSYILKNILEKTTDKIVATSRNIEKVTENQRIKWVSCDVSDKKQVDDLIDSITDKEKLKVVYLAAYHNPDLVEKNQELAWSINVTSLSYFINRLGKVKCFFYPSSDSVYGASIDGYHFKEGDSLNPVNTYGRQKAAAESVVVWHGGHVSRFPFLIAPSLSPVKDHFYDKLKNDLLNGKVVEMFTDSLRSSLNFNTAAELLIRVMEEVDDEKIPPFLNICGDKDMSKYETGLIMARKLGVDEKLVLPVSVESTSGIFEAKRAGSSLMDNSLLKKLLGIDNIKFEL